MNKVIKQISQIDNMADLNAVIQAVKDQQSLLRNRAARQAKARELWYTRTTIHEV